MSLVLYAGGTVLATSVLTSVATKAITSAPSIVTSVLNRTGISSYFTSTAKANYDHYYSKAVSEGRLYDVIIQILAKYADKSYNTRQDPRFQYNDGILTAIAGTKIEDKWISSDILCFRNSTSFYDYSAYGRARVRFNYDSLTKQAIIRCKRKTELKDFCDAICAANFKDESLVFIGVG